MGHFGCGIKYSGGVELIELDHDSAPKAFHGLNMHKGSCSRGSSKNPQTCNILRTNFTFWMKDTESTVVVSAKLNYDRSFGIVTTTHDMINGSHGHLLDLEEKIKIRENRDLGACNQMGSLVL